jgi:rhamnose utilization protein RhaD (predicted bifunctional aldolase and dehydrogenase)
MVHNSWDAEAAAKCGNELGLRAYSSRLLGNDPSLVLLGGGNTSVKLTGDSGEDLLYVKRTGADLAHVTEQDFTPLKLAPIREMLRRSHLDYAGMMQELADHVAIPHAPNPSIETLLHAALPARYVEHTHADSILAVTNTGGGMALAQEVFGDVALVVPYRHSGFALAKICAEAWATHATPQTIGIILMHHGAVACGPTAQESYVNMLRLVARAEDYLAAHVAALPKSEPSALDATGAYAIATLRREISRVAGYPLLLTRSEDPLATAFARSASARNSAWQSPATPQHAVFARRLPMLGGDIAAYAKECAIYLRLLSEGPRRLDAAPRIVLDDDLGMLAAGITPWHMDAAAISYCHTIATMLCAEAHDSYVGLPPLQVLEAELEYGGFEHRIAAHRTADVALAGTVNVLAPSLGAMLEPVKRALLAASGAVATLDGGLAPGAFIPVISRFGGIDTLLCTAADRDLIEQAKPWLSVSPVSARVVLIDSGDSRALTSQFSTADIDVLVFEPGSGVSSDQSAQKIAHALALPSILTFPDFA